MASHSLIQIADFLESNKINFADNIPERLKCIICKDILKNAKQTACGCKVCEKCIGNYLRGGEKPCPSNQPDCVNSKLKLDRDIHQDNATNKEISNLKVICPFTKCGTIDMLRNMINHVENCDLREVTCDKCSKPYPYKEKDIHINKTCEERTVVCEHCMEKMTDLVKRSDHLNSDSDNLCSEYMAKCPNECSSDVVRLKEHLLKCTNKKLDCPLKSLDCIVGKLTRAKLNDHLQSEIVPHLTNLITEFMKEKNIHEALKKDLQDGQETLKHQMADIQKLTEMRIKSERSIDELKRRGPGSASAAEKSVIYRNACFIWKISNFESLKSDALSGGRASITSDPFYTSEFGYKMCLRIYPAGDGIGRGSFLSVFFALMKGEYDDILQWPFKQKVTLSLLDQTTNGAKNYSDTFKPDARSACYQKPVEDCNIASGSPKFIALASLIPTSTYYQNDTIFLKISVDTMGIAKP